jgi:hypothetical protein
MIPRFQRLSVSASRGLRTKAATHPAAKPRELPGTTEYREELRARRKEWISELDTLGQQKAAEVAERIRLRDEKRAKAEEERQAYLAQKSQSISNFEDFGVRHVGSGNGGGANPLLKDIVTALDKEEGKLGSGDLVAGLKDASSSTEQKDTPKDPLVLNRRAFWARYIRLRRAARHSRFLSHEQSLSDTRLSHLLRLYSDSENFITRSNIESKIDAFLGENGHTARPVDYRVETKVPDRNPVELALEIKEERRRKALEDAISGGLGELKKRVEME